MPYATIAANPTIRADRIRMGPRAPRAFRRRGHYFWIKAGRWSSLKPAKGSTGGGADAVARSVGSLLCQPQVRGRRKLRQGGGRLPSP